MPREAFQTLSEPMYYVLLALTEKQRGVDIINRVSEISGGRVMVGPGTVYAMLDKFVQHKVIGETACAGRMRSYRITAHGMSLLKAEYERSQILYNDGRKILEKFVESGEIRI